MKRDEALQLTNNAIEELVAAVDRGQSQTLTAYLDTMARFHQYSFANILLISVQRPDATHVAGYNAWLKLHRYVRKGERGIAILAPMVSRKRISLDDPPEDLDPYEGRGPGRALVVSRLAGFKVVHVFDISQTEGNDIAEFSQVSGDPALYLERIKQFIRQQGIQLDYDFLPRGALGVSADGEITLRPGLSPAEEFSTLAHEAAHELLHKGDRRAETTKTIREVEAEAVAYVICRAVGLNSASHSADYIQLYQGDKETLSRSLEHVRQAAGQILTAINSAPSVTNLNYPSTQPIPAGAALVH